MAEAMLSLRVTEIATGVAEVEAGAAERIGWAEDEAAGVNAAICRASSAFLTASPVAS